MGNCWASVKKSISPVYDNTFPEVRKCEAPVVDPGMTTVIDMPSEHVITMARPEEIGRIIKPRLKAYAYSELKNATRNFKPASLVGEGGFGRVYKGWIDPTTMAPSRVGIGIPVAVKRCSPDSSQGLKEWKTEIDYLGKFCHPNLVRMIGYCCEDRELLLVYEYVQKGSLEYHLFRQNVEPLSWNKRIGIAIDAALGLDFLHRSENTVIFRDFKAANILLDQDYRGKLSDFGLARQGPVDKSHLTTNPVGTYGYAAPEYINTGHLYVTSDVYGFGVVLLEMLTGKKAYDKNRPPGQISLAEWYQPMLGNKSKLKKIIDPRMPNYPPEGVSRLAQLIFKCIDTNPKTRPLMSEVLLHLKHIRTIKSPKSSRPTSSKSLAHDNVKGPMNARHHFPSPLHHHGKRAVPAANFI